MDIKKDLASMVYNFFDKKISVSANTLANKSAIKNENMTNKELLENYKKIKKMKKHIYLYKQYLGC